MKNVIELNSAKPFTDKGSVVSNLSLYGLNFSFFSFFRALVSEKDGFIVSTAK